MHDDLLQMTTDIVIAHFSKNTVGVGDIGPLIISTYQSLVGLGSPPEPEPVELVPAVPVKQSIKPDYIVCLEDGKKFKMMKRHLMLNYGLTPDQYRAKWGLPANYPMCSPNHTAKRRAISLEFGLGRKAG